MKSSAIMVYFFSWWACKVSKLFPFHYISHFAPQAMQGEKIRLSQTWLVDISHLFLVISSSCNVFIFAVQVSARKCFVSI